MTVGLAWHLWLDTILFYQNNRSFHATFPTTVHKSMYLLQQLNLVGNIIVRVRVGWWVHSTFCTTIVLVVESHGDEECNLDLGFKQCPIEGEGPGAHHGGCSAILSFLSYLKKNYHKFTFFTEKNDVCFHTPVSWCVTCVTLIKNMLFHKTQNSGLHDILVTVNLQ